MGNVITIVVGCAFIALVLYGLYRVLTGGLPASEKRGPMLRYMGGLAIEGHANGYVWVNVEDGKLRLRFLRAEEFLSLAAITGIVSGNGQSISAGRVITTGVVGLVWKKTDHYLVISYASGGLDAQLVLKGEPRNLEKVQAQIMRARAAAEGEPVGPA